MKGQHLRKSFFTRILVSYLCFVLISLISSVMIYRLASTRLIENTTASDYAAFRQFYSMVDQELNNAADKVSELAGDYSGFLSLLEQTSARKGYTVYQIIHRLRLVTSNSLGDLSSTFQAPKRSCPAATPPSPPASISAFITTARWTAPPFSRPTSSIPGCTPSTP